MPVKRALQLHDKENNTKECWQPNNGGRKKIIQSPAKRHAPEKNYSPMTGTRLMSPATKPGAGTSKAGGKKTNTPKTKKPMTDAERIVFLRSKVRRSVKDLMKYRHQLETLMPVEGSSELRSLFLMGPADLQTELERHEDLSDKVDSCVHRADTNKGHVRGIKQSSSSYEFLKAILSR